MSPGAPRFIRTEPVRRPPLRWGLPLTALVLFALLLLQIVLADRTRLATDPGWRPRLQLLCGLLRCQLPPWREPGAFTLTARDVRPHPKVPGVLVISASFRNDARFPQPWPQLELSLADIEGQPLGLRRFAPREYLGSEPPATPLAPAQSVSLSLEVLDPGKRAVAFSFDFR